MNYFQLVLKQMRQRALSTWLTTLSVMLGVALAIAIMVLGRESESLFGQNDYGYDAIIGKKGSTLQLVLNTIYHLDVSPGNIPYDQYTRLLNPHLPKGVPYPPGQLFQIRQGRRPHRASATHSTAITASSARHPSFSATTKTAISSPTKTGWTTAPAKSSRSPREDLFAYNKFEAVVGSEIPRLTGKTIGSDFQATHGIAVPGRPPDIHMQDLDHRRRSRPHPHRHRSLRLYPPRKLLHHRRARRRPHRPSRHPQRRGHPAFDPDSDETMDHTPDAERNLRTTAITTSTPRTEPSISKSPPKSAPFPRSWSNPAAATPSSNSNTPSTTAPTSWPSTPPPSCAGSSTPSSSPPASSSSSSARW